MSKELPYFKFTVAQFLLGRISGEKDGVKGMFIDACGHYWHKKCDIKRVELDKKLGKKRVETLLNKEYLEEINGYIIIPFLDEQREELINSYEVSSENGVKGAKKRWAKSDSQAITSKEDKDKEEDKDKILLKFVDPLFLTLIKKWFSYKKSRMESYKSVESEEAFYKKLLKLSGSDLSIAEEIVQDSIASNYAGIFPYKGSKALNVGTSVKSGDKVATTLNQHDEAKKILHGKS
jgi:hypothetical protein